MLLAGGTYLLILGTVHATLFVTISCYLLLWYLSEVLLGIVYNQNFISDFDDKKNEFSSFCSIAECFAFLVCTKWSNPVIHRSSRSREVSSSSTSIRYLDWNSGLVVSPEEEQHHDRVCGLQDIGGHIMKIPIIGFQILLCMRLEVCFVFEFCSWLPFQKSYNKPAFVLNSGNPS